VILYPAIDIRGGKAVRLEQGDYDRETAFDADPLDAARRWLEQGAEALHVVDLDGAREGAPVNIEHLARICESCPVAVQAGGGLRTAADVESVLAAGAGRAILGTAALADPALVEGLAADHGERIVAAADTRGDRVAIEGWERESGIRSAKLVEQLGERGVHRFLYTAVEVDGTLEGPSIESLREVAAAAGRVGAKLVYAGGVGTLEHLRALADLRLAAVDGVVVGRALYEGSFTVEQARAALSVSRR
jgi:phosphoribosylformimino-5-aminoimidazole carboxamide ribotide isomerase